MDLKMNNLEICFWSAKRVNAKFVGVKVWTEGMDECELIINPYENIDKKLEYYKTAYNEDLVLKVFNGVKIVGFTYGDSLEEIEKDLIG